MIVPTSTTSLVAYAPIVLPILEMIQPKRICEVGSSAGEHSKFLSTTLKKYSGELVMIDPCPRGDYSEWMKANNNASLIKDFSLNAIPQVGHADVWFVDGDHNWYNVYHELHLIDQTIQKSQTPAIIYLHDVAWPCGRRDMYCDPSRIPKEFLQPYAQPDVGVFVPEISRGILRGLYWALREGGPRNGVLTAVEDFVKSTKSQYYWVFIPAFLGLGALIHASHPLIANIVEFYQPYHNNAFMAQMENDRINNYVTAVMLHEDLGEKTAFINKLVCPVT